MENREYCLQDDGISIHAKLDFPQDREDKKLPLLILIHGFTGHMEEEHLLAVVRAANEAGFAVLRAEMYGHGESGGSFREHTIYKWIGNAMAVIDHARQLDFVTDLYLSGHSQGGLLVMLLAAMERERVRAILPLSPAAMIPEDARRGELLGIRFDPEHLPEELWVESENMPLGNNYIRVAQMIDVDDAIRRFTGPVLIVHGTGDESVPVQCAIDVAAKYADAKLVTIPDDTHCFDLHPDMLADAVREFLETVRR